MADTRLATKFLLASIIVLFSVAATGMSKLSALTMIMIASLVFATTIIAMIFDKAIVHFATNKTAKRADKETSTAATGSPTPTASTATTIGKTEHAD